MMKTLSSKHPETAAVTHSRPASRAGVELKPVRHQAWWLRGLYAISFESRAARFCLYAFIVVVVVVATVMASGDHNPHWNTPPKAPAQSH